MSDDASDAPTPRTPRAEVRERLLNAGAEVFAEQGVHEARLDEVAARAGFSKGAVYSNFSSKEDLVGQVMQRATNLVLGELRELVSVDIAAVDIADVVRAAFGRHDQSAQFALLSEFRGYASRHPEFLPEFVRQRRELQDGVLELVRLWFGAHPEVDPGMPLEDFATVLIGANVGIVFDSAALPEVNPGEIVARLVEAVIRRR
ncbi:TetR/AcrR family transcriptional regulator [Curtobacterium sp. MCPF17_002]|uniref:TetR/AcrR family transcriptional regulator n=1 Tax=Curtobacterium sp. MCPF17_002 TaxID=2175645 RepID=UPI0015E88F73|nr:TetR/AcrR family transcriptional regulator [Curtobacterium sp. MCPF17_002]WIB76778.1 TetR/AcrR family transcriptional regulator [Curtobacterium sp. MCPF17_002]